MVYDTNIHGKWNIKSGRNLILKNANKVFEVVIDVKNYPKFIPWCYGVKIIS